MGSAKTACDIKAWRGVSIIRCRCATPRGSNQVEKGVARLPLYVPARLITLVWKVKIERVPVL